MQPGPRRLLCNARVFHLRVQSGWAMETVWELVLQLDLIDYTPVDQKHKFPGGGHVRPLAGSLGKNLLDVALTISALR